MSSESFFAQWSWGEMEMEVWILSLFFMISKVGVVFGCSIPLMFSKYDLFWSKEVKLKYTYYFV